MPERFENLGSFVYFEIGASTVGNNGIGKGVEEEQRRREEDDAKTKGEGDIWRFRVPYARETMVVS